MSGPAPRVVMVSGSAPPVIDGVGQHAAVLLEHLAAARPAWRWTHLARRFRWFHLPFGRRGAVHVVRPARGWTPAGTDAAVRALRALRPDLVHIQDQVHSFYETDAAVRLAEAANCPVVATLHEFHTELPSVRHTIALARRADGLIANDRRTFDRCREATGKAPDLLGWSPANVPPADPAWGVRVIPGRLVTFGLINALKQLDVVAEAVERVVAARPDVTWRITGPFAPESNPLHAELARRLAHHAIAFTGGTSGGAGSDRRLRTWLAQAAVMLLPYADGAAMRRTSLTAAWAFGLPVITTPPTAEEPAIVDGENCVLVAPGDLEGWARAIERVLDDDALAERLRQGSLRAARQFGWEPLATRILALYDRLLEAAR